MSNGRIVLGEEDFEETDGTGAQAAAASELPPVARQAPLHVGVPAGGPPPLASAPHPYGATVPGTTSNLFDDPRYGLPLAAAVGTFAGWALDEVFHVVSLMEKATTRTGADAAAGVWVAVVALVFAGFMQTYDRLVHGAVGDAGARFARAALPALAAGFVAGCAAQAIYGSATTSILRQALESGHLPGTNDIRFYLVRALGWGVFGALIGPLLGVLDGSTKKAVNGLIGGAAGGAAGGLIFQFFGSNMTSSEGFARLLGLLAVGVLIAVATRVVETVRRESWLRVTAGGMSGKEFILYHLVTRIGASPDCEIFLLKDPAVRKVHAQIADEGTRRVLRAVAADGPVLVNGTAVAEHVLRSGDSIQIGTTVLAYSERALAPAHPVTTHAPSR